MKEIVQTKEKDSLWYFDPIEAWFKIGQMVKIQLNSPLSNTTIGIVTGIHITNVYSPPTVDVAFRIRWNSGELGGYIEIKNIMLGRYLSANQFFTEVELNIAKNICDRVDEDDLFYVDEISNTERKLVYPFTDGSVLEGAND